MDRIYETSLLLDFYGQLLTDRQYEILDLHYNNDFTLTEIAEQLNISRQGVFDNEKRGRAQLIEYENKLGLLSKFSKQKQRAQNVLDGLKKLKLDEIGGENRIIIDNVVKEIDELVNDI
jgi:predicted DNA-binding protein YlxM (UPF0122 family)